jgi:uncharacterized protein (DUF2267 family)
VQQPIFYKEKTMKYLLLTLPLLLLLNACQEKPQSKETKANTTHEEPVKEEPVKEEPAKEEPAKEEPAKEEPAKEEPAKEEPVKEEPAKEEATTQEHNQTKLEALGVKVEGEKITIDTNQTKEFFNTLKDKMHREMEKISHDVEVNVAKTKEATIALTKEHIDLNKTKNLLNEWNSKIEGFVEDFKTDLNNTDNNTTKGK